MLETIPRRFVRMFVENPWHWVGGVFIALVATNVFEALLPLGYPIAAMSFVAILLLSLLCVPRMTVYGRPIGARFVGALYRRWTATEESGGSR